MSQYLDNTTYRVYAGLQAAGLSKFSMIPWLYPAISHTRHRIKYPLGPKSLDQSLQPHGFIRIFTDLHLYNRDYGN